MHKYSELKSFLEYFEGIFLYLLHSNEDLRSTLVYPSLQTVDISSSYINYIFQDPSSKLYNVEGWCYEPNQTKIDLIAPVFNLVPFKILDRYRCLNFPSILHSLPPKHYKYLHMFNGENLTTEKHIQAFGHFADLFEIKHDDVFMRFFSQSLKRNAKAWCRHL